jgi:hypothetical protein
MFHHFYSLAAFTGDIRHTITLAIIFTSKVTKNSIKASSIKLLNSNPEASPKLLAILLAMVVPGENN